MSSFDRLHATGDIRAVFSARAVAHGSAMVVHARRRDDEGLARVTVVANRKVGPAVARNRAKRRLRAALDQVDVASSLDVVVQARSAALGEDFDVLRKQLQHLLDRVATRVRPPGGAASEPRTGAPAGAAGGMA